MELFYIFLRGFVSTTEMVEVITCMCEAQGVSKVCRECQPQLTVSQDDLIRTWPRREQRQHSEYSTPTMTANWTRMSLSRFSLYSLVWLDCDSDSDTEREIILLSWLYFTSRAVCLTQISSLSSTAARQKGWGWVEGGNNSKLSWELTTSTVVIIRF